MLLVALAAVALVPSAAGCARSFGPSHDSAARYVVTVSPINLGIGSGRFCVAIDVRDPAGVWWWQPGKDCTTRSTGPGVFHAEGAVVTRSAGRDTFQINFRIQLIRQSSSTEPSYANIALTLADRHLQAAATGSRVATTTRQDLDIPDAWR
jgi:hypothetical protein